MYYIHIVGLENCRYSNSAKELVESYGIENKYNEVSYHNKDKFKSAHHSTFPIIYMKRSLHMGQVLIGGYSELNILFNKFYSKPYDSVEVKNVMEKYKMSKRLVLRFIQLINKKLI